LIGLVPITVLVLILIAVVVVLSAKVSTILLVVVVSILLLVLVSILGLGLDVLLHQIDDLVGNAEILDCAAADVALVHSPKLVAILKRRKSICWNIFSKISSHHLTFDVQMTSRRLMFIHVSQLIKCPLYVSPFFSSTNWNENFHCKRLFMFEKFPVFLPLGAIVLFSRVIAVAGR
jgi:hypothetical protein